MWEKTPKRDAKIGKDNSSRQRIKGIQDVEGEMNANGELLAEFCEINELVIRGAIFPHT